MKLLYWPLIGELLHLVQRDRDWAGPQPHRSILSVPNVTAHPSTASVPITVLLCSLNVPVKGLTRRAGDVLLFIFSFVCLFVCHQRVLVGHWHDRWELCWVSQRVPDILTAAGA